jgi:hypothetical protein
VERDLPEHLRSRDISLGYHLVDLREAKMSERAMLSLFEQMDILADALPRGVAFAGDCQLEFRRLQKHRFPHLETDQWLDLFQLWTHAYEARERAATQARLAELVEERRSLFVSRTFLPPPATAANARLVAIGHELAGICAPSRPQPPLGTWGAE